MNFEVEKDLLLKSLIMADSIITAKSANYILSLCLINVTKNKLEIVTTDKDIMLKTAITVESANDFSFLVNGKKLANIIKEFPKGDVAVSVDENYSVSISSKSLKGNYTLVGMPKGDFPEFHKIDEVVSFEIEQTELREMIRKVVYSVANDNIKPAFCGIFFSTDESAKLTAVATDAKRLSMFSLPIDPSLKLKEGIIVPKKAIGEVYRVLSDSGKCVFSIGLNMCSVKIENTEIVSRLIDGQFPNYKQVIPREFSETIVIPREKFLDTIRRVMVFTKEPFYKVSFKLDGEVLFVSSESQEFGKAEEELPVMTTNNSKLEFVLSANYLYESLREMDEEEIEMKILMATSPIVIKPKNRKDELSVIMPIQMKNE